MRCRPLGVSLGLVIGFPLVTFLMSHLGWALSFHVLAFINLLVGLLLVRVFIHPRTTGVVQRSSEPMMQRVLPNLHSGLENANARLDHAG
ncbi:Arabinose efflux permease [Serratia fonticola]|uniref:Arabinose efflux permease n=1 Tax=Serratia fonticola TaxID=47917 RepID=A0A4U9TWE7_SERFO|nr:Arabinose efflux permease [Serratia fonticola]